MEGSKVAKGKQEETQERPCGKLSPPESSASHFRIQVWKLLLAGSRARPAWKASLAASNSSNSKQEVLHDVRACQQRKGFKSSLQKIFGFLPFSKKRPRVARVELEGFVGIRHRFRVVLELGVAGRALQVVLGEFLLGRTERNGLVERLKSFLERLVNKEAAPTLKGFACRGCGHAAGHRAQVTEALHFVFRSYPKMGTFRQILLRCRCFLSFLEWNGVKIN